MIIGAVVLLGIMAVASFNPAPQNVVQTSTLIKTATQLRTGGTVQIGQSFVTKMGSDDVPVEMTFTSASFTTTYSYIQPDSGYKLLVVEIRAKNIGLKETSLFVMARWEVTVDKGYVYESKHEPFLAQTLRPEEEKTDAVVFEILDTTTPVEVRQYDFLINEPALILDLRGVQIAGVLSAPRISIEPTRMKP